MGLRAHRVDVTRWGRRHIAKLQGIAGGSRTGNRDIFVSYTTLRHDNLSLDIGNR